jgi:hypothetical protein
MQGFFFASLAGVFAAAPEKVLRFAEQRELAS